MSEQINSKTCLQCREENISVALFCRRCGARFSAAVQKDATITEQLIIHDKAGKVRVILGGEDGGLTLYGPDEDPQAALCATENGPQLHLWANRSSGARQVSLGIVGDESGLEICDVGGERRRLFVGTAGTAPHIQLYDDEFRPVCHIMASDGGFLASVGGKEYGITIIHTRTSIFMTLSHQGKALRSLSVDDAGFHWKEADPEQSCQEARVEKHS